MIGRKTVVGLSLLCALMFSAMAVQSAVAAPTKSVRLTAFTCKKEKTKEFTFNDEHCTSDNKEKKGEFEHREIAKDVTTAIDAKRKAGSPEPKLVGELFGVKAEVSCEKAESTGNIHNVESGGAEKKHTVTGELTTTFSGNCRVTNQPNCTVQEKITAETLYEGVEGEVAKGGKNEMGVQQRPKEGETFTTLKFGSKEGKLCLLPAEAKVTGTAIATGVEGGGKEPVYSGAINVFTKAMTEETLKFGGNPASFTLESTVTMKPEPEKEANPITLTTVT
jgi:hypothetical protein